MQRYTIPSPDDQKHEIAQSHHRCRSLGVNPKNRRNPCQERLTPSALERRLKNSGDFLHVAISQIQELYQFVAGAGFAVNIADRDGYILHAIGDAPIIEKLKAGNCSPGYRWTEKDVGTSVISLALARKIPVQINDDEHYCRRGYGHTCSASPVFDEQNHLIGVIAMSGNADQVHPHTLGMVITAARAIENQMRIQQASKALLLRNEYMNAIIDSIDSGVIAVDKDGRINQINNKGRQILEWKQSLEGSPLDVIMGDQIDVDRLLASDSDWVDREMFIHTPNRRIHLICTVKPIFDHGRRMHGIIIVFNEIKRIHKLVNDMAGALARFTFADIVGISSQIQETKHMATLAARGASTVLLLGETGTGKELFAQAIHNASNRRDHPFIAINCAAIPRELLESELFGYVQGAFTGARRGGRPGKFELADGGTLFLDEIGDMPTDMQVKLLRVLQTAEVCRVGQHKSISVDVRIIAATNIDLTRAIQQGAFRQDLFYRLNVLPIRIPALRERSEDILPLTGHILKRCCRALQKPELIFSSAAEQALLNYSWTGNIRELENVVERAVNLTDGPAITPDTLGLPRSASATGSRRCTRLVELEKQAIGDAIADSGFNLSQTAKNLGISRATLYNKMKKYRLTPNRQSV